MKRNDGPPSRGSSGGGIPCRPTLFRALGQGEPPATIEINGRRVACKFNRTHRLFFLPMGWLGRHLTERECNALQRLKGMQGFPVPAGPVFAKGILLRNAVAHDWIEGETFKKRSWENAPIPASFS